jgi:hypothetical protein
MLDFLLFWVKHQQNEQFYLLIQSAVENGIIRYIYEILIAFQQADCSLLG